MNDDLGLSTFNITWGNIKSGTEAITTNITNSGNIPDVILCDQADAIAASLVALGLGVPLAVAHTNPRVNNMILDCLPKLSNPIRSGEYVQATRPKIVIISTLIDDKRNVDDLVTHYTKHGHAVTTMCIYSRKTVINPSDYHWVLLSRYTHYTFPWNNK